MKINDIIQKYNNGEKLTMLTCYDYWSAKLLSATDVDCILVGDSASMIMHGHDSTIMMTTEIMSYHVASVSRGAPNKFIIADMPFMSVKKGIKQAIEYVELLVRSGANAIKIEGVDGHEDVISHIVNSGIPVMGHLGYIPQSANMFGSKIVQGKTNTAHEKIISEAHKLEQLGCFSIVLECVPANLAKEITNKIHIPTIGIGAGADVSGQVLVLQDMLGANSGFSPKFLKLYGNIGEEIKNSVNSFCSEVQSSSFPENKHSY